MNIDYDLLRDAVAGVLDDSVMGLYDLDSVLLSATPCWDNTGVMVTATDFVVIVDSVSYEVVEVSSSHA